MVAGADLAYVGSAFIATEEANASPEYKQMLVDSSAGDIVYANLFTDVHGNYLRKSVVTSSDVRVTELTPWMHHYNFQRPHSALSHHPPALQVKASNLCQCSLMIAA